MRIMLVSKLLLPITIACIQYPFASSWSFQQPTKPTKSNEHNDLKQWLGSWFQNSAWAAELHESHVVSPTVQHMMKGTPLASASVAEKLSFATGPGGRLVERIMAAEQELLGEWKVRKIVEAAMGRLEPESNEFLFDVEGSHDRLCDVIDGHAVVLFSFVDCPWCLLAKRMLDAEPYTSLSRIPPEAIVKVIELEELGWEGKRLRASIALATGRTSMPACFIGGRSVGGFSDGFSDGYEPEEQHLRVCEGSPGMKELHDRDELMDLIVEAMKLQ
eukprot:CAMPEP_0194362756 /NCGR_PEP_ID=MMETSP0174-20130528/10586_1 /TAXON_ID=216777 /ORGANISM="Proboscia alata, Strain PI-D3" /LENGTH=273 /DNA_ID=CAMNT_0039135853 /DNA_START=51 /DNA_END=872 /DNA_ORIENTATION=-